MKEISKEKIEELFEGCKGRIINSNEDPDRVFSDFMVYLSAFIDERTISGQNILHIRDLTFKYCWKEL